MIDDIKKRDLGIFSLLMIVTLGFYSFYLIPKLGEGVNHLIGQKIYKFSTVLIISIVTFGIAKAVFEIFYAYNLEQNPDYTNGKWSTRNLGGYVLVLNIVALALAFVTGGLALIFSFVIGCWATWLVQNEINRYIDLNVNTVTTVDIDSIDSIAKPIV